MTLFSVTFTPQENKEPAPLKNLVRRLRLRPELLGGIGRALSSRNYRLYACGHVAVVHGWWGNRLGIGWMTWELTGSAAWLGIVAFAGMMPVALAAPFAGALADRHGHRKVSMIAGVVSGFVTLAIGLIALSGGMTIPLLLGLSVLQGLLFGTEFPARQALIPQLVGRENIPAAVAFNSTTFQVGSFIGPVVAGLLITRFGAGASVLLAAATNFWLVAMLLLIRHTHVPSADRAGAGMLSEIAAGFRYITREKSLRLLMLLSFTSGLLLRPYTELLPGFAADVFGRGAEGLAALNAAAGLGALAAALVLVFRGRNQGLTGIMLTGAVAAPLVLTLFAVTTDFRAALAILAVAAMMMLAAQVGSYSLIQNLAAPAMRGRVISVNVAIAVSGPALGALAIGGLAEAIGLQTALAASTLAAFAIIAAILPAVKRRAAVMEREG